MTNETLDYDRLTRAWMSKTDYDPDALTQPWEMADSTAANSIGAGWACIIGRAILVEREDGVHIAYVYESQADADEQWPSYYTAYSDPREFTASIKLHFTADDEDHAAQRANAMAASLEQFDGVSDAQASEVEE